MIQFSPLTPDEGAVRGRGRATDQGPQILLLWFVVAGMTLSVGGQRVSANPSSPEGPAVENCCGYNSPGNPFPCSSGNCTWWCYYKRPDVYPACSRDAEHWLVDAQAGGLPTGDTPKSSSIAVFVVYPGSSVGHVAYVESVNGDGSINVTEMAWGGWGGGQPCVRSHTYAAGAADGYIFPETSAPGTTQRSWLFNLDGNPEGWTANGVTAQMVSGSNWIINPDVDPQMISPLLLRDRNSINYLKTGMKNKGGNTDGRVFFSSPEGGYGQNGNAAFVNPNNNNFNHIVVWLSNLAGWAGASNIDHVRIDPVASGVPVGGTDDVLTDYIFLRLDNTSPNQPDITSVAPSGWTNGNITVSFQGTDPTDTPSNPVGPDAWGSGVEYFRYRADPAADQTVYPTSPYQNPAQASVTYTAGSLTPGQHVFHVYSKDFTNHFSADRQTTLYFDNVAPSVPVGVTATPPTNNVNSFAFSWAASSDSHSGVAGYYWKVNGGSETFTTGTSLPTGAYATSEGANTFSVRAADNAGNLSGYGSVGFVFSTGGCGPPLPNCAGGSSTSGVLAAQIGNVQDARIIGLPQHTAREWEKSGHRASGFLSPGTSYRIGFLYRTKSDAEFGWGLVDRQHQTKIVGWDGTSVRHPTNDGEWHPFWSAPFTVMATHLDGDPAMVLLPAAGQAGTVELDQMRLFIVSESVERSTAK